VRYAGGTRPDPFDLGRWATEPAREHSERDPGAELTQHPDPDSDQGDREKLRAAPGTGVIARRVCRIAHGGGIVAATGSPRSASLATARRASPARRRLPSPRTRAIRRG